MPKSSKSLTTAPVAPPARESLRPEWLRVEDVRKVFGIKKAVLYGLIRENKVKSVSLRKRGALRGTRLVSYESIQELIAKASLLPA